MKTIILVASVVAAAATRARRCKPAVDPSKAWVPKVLTYYDDPRTHLRTWFEPPPSPPKQERRVILSASSAYGAFVVYGPASPALPDDMVEIFADGTGTFVIDGHPVPESVLRRGWMDLTENEDYGRQP